MTDMKRPTTIKRLLLTLSNGVSGVRMAITEAMPGGTPDAVLFVQGRADGGFDKSFTLVRRIDRLEAVTDASGLATFDFATPFGALPDLTFGVKIPSGLLAANAQLVSVTASRAVIRAVKVLAGAPVLAAGLTIWLRAEASD